MVWLNNLYLSLKMIGSSSTDGYEEAKRIVVSNQIMSLYFLLLFPYIPIFYYMGSSLLSLITVGLSASIIFCILLNKNRWFSISRSLFILTISLPIYFFAAILGPETGIQFVSFMTMCISFIIFDKTQNYLKYFFIFLQVSIFLTLEITQYSFFYKETFSSINYTYFRYTVIVNVFLLILATLTYFSSLSTHYKKTLADVNKFSKITNREAEIIHLLLEGKTNKMIAETLYIEVSTVKTHLKNIFKKQNVSNRTQLLASFTEPSIHVGLSNPTDS